MPKPVVARSVEDIIKARGVKPVLSPNLAVLSTLEALQVKKLLFIGVGCQVMAVRSIEKYLGLEKLYVLGTNCTDNGRRETLDKFLKAATTRPEEALHYEFMTDFKVHIKHLDGTYEKKPYFCLPANDLSDVIAPSCFSCFDYTNSVADLVVGYMAVPFSGKENMDQHLQYALVRNERGKELLDSVQERLEIQPTVTAGDRRSLVMQTVISDDEAKMGNAPEPAPLFVGNMIAWILNVLGRLGIAPRGLEFAKYSIEYHYIRNYLYVMRNWSPSRASQHIPSFVKAIVRKYNAGGEIDARLRLPKPKHVPKAFPKR
jgi:7-hydroxymethyl chlorophyll a reductase